MNLRNVSMFPVIRYYTMGNYLHGPAFIITVKMTTTTIEDPEWPSGLVLARHAGAPGSLPGRVGLSEINFSDLYCGWFGRIINVEYNTIQYNTTHYNTTGAWWYRGMFGALQLEGCGFESLEASA